MSENAPATEAAPRSFWRGKGARFFVVAVLTLLMTVPLMMLGAITSERERYSADTIRSIGGVWGAEQRLIGPMLVVPTERTVVRTTSDGAVRSNVQTRMMALSPDTLKIDASATTQTRSRGIFDTTVFNASAGFSGQFGKADFASKLHSDEVILWDRARIALHVSDARAFDENAVLNWGGREVDFEPAQSDLTGSVSEPMARSMRRAAASAPAPGVMIALTGDPRKATGDFAFDLVLRGSGRLHVAPMGRNTEVSIAADWPHPSFDGAFLPRSREVREDGFTASWSVPYLARGFPAQMSGQNERQLLGVGARTAFGVTFYQPVNLYQKVERALKYAILFIGLTFLSVFLIELATRRRTHAVQYLLVGLAQCVFFLLLLALSEQIGFAAAYLASAAATIALLVAYIGLGMKAGRGTWVAGAVLVTLYGFLYLLLESRDYALLIGAIAAFLSVAVTMAATRNVDWWADEDG